MTTAGARQASLDRRNDVERQAEAINRLRAIRDELVSISEVLKNMEGDEGWTAYTCEEPHHSCSGAART